MPTDGPNVRSGSSAASTPDPEIIEWWAQNYWRQIRRLHKAYANLGCVDGTGSAMHYTGEVGPKDCTCKFCTEFTEPEIRGLTTEQMMRAVERSAAEGWQDVRLDVDWSEGTRHDADQPDA